MHKNKHPAVLHKMRAVVHDFIQKRHPSIWLKTCREATINF